MSERENPAPAAHDRGGWATEEPIDQREHQWADWEYRTQALARVLGSKGLVVTEGVLGNGHTPRVDRGVRITRKCGTCRIKVPMWSKDDDATRYWLHTFRGMTGRAYKCEGCRP